MDLYNEQLNSLLVPDSERKYYNNIVESYRRLVIQLEKTKGVYTANRIKAFQELLKKELLNMNREFTKEFNKEIPNITEASLSAYVYDKEAALMAVGASYTNLNAIDKKMINELIKDEGFLFSYVKANGDIVRNRYTSKDIISDIPNSTYNRVNKIFLAGATVGDSPEKITRDLRPFYTTQQKNDVRTMTRTLIGEATAKANKAWDEENDDIIGKWVYNATLDSRTSSICRSLDGRVWKSKPDAQYWPKLHFNCRSIMVAIPVGYESDQTRPVNLMTASNKKHAKTLKGKEREDYISGFVHNVPMDATFKQVSEAFPQLNTKKFIDTDEYFQKLGL